jgi:hypothetical protein
MGSGLVEQIKIKKENFIDYTKSACETYRNDIRKAGKLLKEDGHMNPEKEKYTLRKILLETLTLILFILAVVSSGMDKVTMVLLGMQTVLYLIIVGQGIKYLVRGKKAYGAAMRLMKAFDTQKSALGIKELSQIHAISRQVLEDRGMTPECDGDEEAVFFAQKAICKIVGDYEEDSMVLIGYLESEKTALLEMQWKDGEKTVLPVANCDCVMEERDDVQFSIHSWASILRVPKQMKTPKGRRKTDGIVL